MAAVTPAAEVVHVQVAVAASTAGADTVAGTAGARAPTPGAAPRADSAVKASVRAVQSPDAPGLGKVIAPEMPLPAGISFRRAPTA